MFRISGGRLIRGNGVFGKTGRWSVGDLGEFAGLYAGLHDVRRAVCIVRSLRYGGNADALLAVWIPCQGRCCMLGTGAGDTLAAFERDCEDVVGFDDCFAASRADRRDVIGAVIVEKSTAGVRLGVRG